MHFLNSPIDHDWLNFRASSDEMKMFYTEHDFPVDLENFEFNLKFQTGNTTLVRSY